MASHVATDQIIQLDPAAIQIPMEGITRAIKFEQTHSREKVLDVPLPWLEQSGQEFPVSLYN